LKITNINSNNAEEKFLTAVEKLSKAIGLPVTIRRRESEGKEEGFRFKVQEEFILEWVLFFGKLIDSVYRAICGYLDLPVVTTFSKSIEDAEPLKIQGRVIFSPETGRPITKQEFDKMVKTIERYLLKYLSGKERKLVIDSVLIGKALSRLLATSIEESVRKASLKEIRYRGYSFDQFPKRWKDYESLFNPSQYELTQLKIVEDYIGEKITGIKESMLQKVKDVYFNGVRQKWSKQRIAQELFDKCGEMNRDIRRIVEYESLYLQSQAFLWEERANSTEDEKLYFIREEVLDGVTCSFCRKIKGTIALYVDHPLEDEHIDDPIAKVAIWDGKTNIGRDMDDWWVPMGPAHPHCRGGWSRYYPDVKGVVKEKDDRKSLEEIASEMNKKAKRKQELWSDAVNEVKELGKTEQDPGFAEKVKELYDEKLKKEDLK